MSDHGTGYAYNGDIGCNVAFQPTIRLFPDHSRDPHQRQRLPSARHMSNPTPLNTPSKHRPQPILQTSVSDAAQRRQTNSNNPQERPTTTTNSTDRRIRRSPSTSNELRLRTTTTNDYYATNKPASPTTRSVALTAYPTHNNDQRLPTLPTTQQADIPVAAQRPRGSAISTNDYHQSNAPTKPTPLSALPTPSTYNNDQRLQPIPQTTV